MSMPKIPFFHPASPKKRKFSLLFFLIPALLLPAAMEAQNLPRHPNPDWTPPGNRENYPGYAIRKQKKENHPTWQKNTNRPGGNTRGGGTTAYDDYRSISEQTGRMENRKSEKIIP